MSRFAVEPGQLFAASGRQSSLATQVAELCGRVEAAGQSAADAAGEMVASAAIADCAMAWSLSLRMLSESISGLAGNVGAAGSAYESTDRGVMPGAPR